MTHDHARDTDLDLVAETAAALMLPEADPYSVLADAVVRHVGENAIVSVSGLDDTGRLCGSRAIRGLGTLADRLIDLLGRSPLEMNQDFPPWLKVRMEEGRLVRVQEGPAALAPEGIPPAVVRGLVSAFGIRDVHAVGFVRGGRVLGGLTLVTRRGGGEPRPAVLEALARLGAIALERREAEDARRRAESRLQVIVDHSVHGILVADGETRRLLLANPAAARMFGRTVDEMLFLEVGDLHPREDLPRVVEVFEAQLRGEHTLGLSLPCRRADGSVFRADIGSAPIEFDGRPCLVGFFVDASPHERAEAERRHLQRQLAQAQHLEAVGRLAGGVAHDFNNMLSVVQTSASLALEEVGPEHPAAEDLRVIRRAADRSAELTRRLLAFARRQTVTPRLLDLNRTVEGMLSMLRRLIGEDVQLSWNPTPSLGAVRIDPAQIDQVLANLCTNARDALGGPGRITLRTADLHLETTRTVHPEPIPPGRYVTLEVEDDGPGIPPGLLERIFDPFVTTKPIGRGVGLGLATVYGIVRQNDGFVEADSRPGEGARFRVHLPRASGVPRDSDPPPSRRPRGRAHETILLVEDDPAILQVTRRLLERFGYAVLAAADPVAALVLAREHPAEIRLLLTDVVMPGMDGRELARRLQAIQPEVRCLFMSGYPAETLAPRGILDDHLHFLPKPFSPEELAVRVRETLDEDP